MNKKIISKKVKKMLADFKNGCTFASAKQNNKVLFQAGPVVQFG